MVARLERAAQETGFGPLQDVAPFDDGEESTSFIIGGFVMIGLGILGILGLGFIAALGVLFYGAILVLIVCILFGPYITYVGLRKALRGETWMGLTPTGGIAVHEKKLDKVMLLPYDATQITVEPSRNKQGTITSVTGKFAGPNNTKLKLDARDAESQNAWNRIMTAFPGQQPLGVWNVPTVQG